jgi:hypothetical protein
VRLPNKKSGRGPTFQSNSGNNTRLAEAQAKDAVRHVRVVVGFRLPPMTTATRYAAYISSMTSRYRSVTTFRFTFKLGVSSPDSGEKS